MRNGRCDEIPKGTTAVISQQHHNGELHSLKEIPHIPLTVKKLSLRGTGIVALPQLREGIEEIDLGFCINLKEIRDIPSTVKKLNLEGTEIEFLPRLHEGIEEINLDGCYGIESIASIPSTVRKLNLRGTGIVALPQLREGIEEIDLATCLSLKTIHNIPSTVKKLCLRSSEVEVLPDLSNGLEEIDLRRCKKIILTPELLIRLEELRNKGCVVKYPPSYKVELLTEAVELLSKVKAKAPAESEDSQKPSGSLAKASNKKGFVASFRNRIEESRKENEIPR